MATEAASTTPQTRFTECEECRRAFEPTREWARFCSDSCRAANWRRSQTESPPMREHQAGGVTQTQHQKTTGTDPSTLHSGTKLRAVMAALARGWTGNRFRAERDLHDHVLPQTIKRLEQLGIEVSRETETVPGFAGSQVRTVRYWLEPAEREKVAMLLGWRAQEKSPAHNLGGTQ